MSKTSGGVRNAIDGGSGGSSASPSQSTLAKRIQYLVGNVGKSNFRQTVQEIDQVLSFSSPLLSLLPLCPPCSLVFSSVKWSLPYLSFNYPPCSCLTWQLQTTNDVDLVETFLIRHLIIAIDFNQIPLEQSQLAQFQLLSQRMSKLASKPNFASIIRTLIDLLLLWLTLGAALDEVKFLAESFIPLFSQSLHLTQPSTMVVALAMARSISVPVKTQGFLVGTSKHSHFFYRNCLPTSNCPCAYSRTVAWEVKWCRRCCPCAVHSYELSYHFAGIYIQGEDATFPNKAALVKYFQKNYQRVLDAYDL